MGNVNLLAYLLLIVPAMLVGFLFARRKMFEPHHKGVMTTITLLNWGLILGIMAPSYVRSVAPTLPDGLREPANLILTLHLLAGGIAQIIATYLVIRMWFEKSLPAWFKVRRIKPYMRTTLALWLTAAVLGIIAYLIWYGFPGAAQTPPAQPEATEEVQPAEATPIPTEDVLPTPEPEADPEVERTEEAEDEAPEPAETEESSG